jgi:hemerythrin-like metal-binding protein
MSAEWTRELVLDHELLDRQHALLFARLTAAGGSLDEDRAAVERAVAAFADELVAHIAMEESLMDETRFPERVRHKAAHDLFMADLGQLRAELRDKGPTPLVAEWLRVRIPEWLRFHIRVNDARLAAHVARREAQPGGAAPPKRDGRTLS